MAQRRNSVTELDGDDDKTKFAALCSLPVYRQAKWFLKTYWSKKMKFGENPDLREHLYQAAKDLKRRCDKGENELEQLAAHHFLEKIDAAITYTDFKSKFKDLDLDFNNKLSLTEYLVYKFDLSDMKSINQLVNAKQVVVAGLGAAEAELEECQRDYEEAQEAHAAVTTIMEEINQQKAAHIQKAETLTKKIEKMKGKTVKEKMAQKVYDEHMLKAPGVDNKTEITQKAAVRKSKKANKKLQKELAKAEKMVEEIKNSGVAAHAVLWWMERNLKEMEKTMSKKQFAKKMAKIDKKKAAADGDAEAMAALGGK